jgi:hypothetical protein
VSLGSVKTFIRFIFVDTHESFSFVSEFGQCN